MKNTKTGGGKMMQKGGSGNPEEGDFFERLLAVDFNNHSEECNYK